MGTGTGAVLCLLSLSKHVAEPEGVHALAGVAVGDELLLRLADIAVIVKNFHKLPRTVCMVNRIAFSIMSILDDARAVAGAETGGGLDVLSVLRAGQIPTDHAAHVVSLSPIMVSWSASRQSQQGIVATEIQDGDTGRSCRVDFLPVGKIVVLPLTVRNWMVFSLAVECSRI